MKSRKGGLGRGLESLFLDNAVLKDASSEQEQVDIKDIFPNPDQPRKFFDQKALEELAESIRQHGVLQPILLRPSVDGRYMIVAGERRFRAAKLAGLLKLPAVVKNLTDSQVASFAVIENLQREDLSPVEEARAYKALMQAENCSQEELGKRLSVPRSTISNAVRVLSLPEGVLEMLQNGELTLGHAKALLGGGLLRQEVEEIAELARSRQLSVRETEQLVKRAAQGKKAEQGTKNEADASGEISSSLKKALGREVEVKCRKGQYLVSFSCGPYKEAKEFATELEKKLGLGSSEL